MAYAKADAIVLGAGMVGVSAALHLQARGRQAVLVDRLGTAGDETSFGNAGIIERGSVYPHMFPRDLATVLRYAFNRAPEVHYHLSALPQVAPWLWRYFASSSAAGAQRSAKALLPLVERCLIEHEALIAEAGVSHLLSKNGWVKLYRSEPSMAMGLRDAERIRRLGLQADVLDAAQVRELEPHLDGPIVGAALWRDPATIADPGALAKAYADLLRKRGGRFVKGDAATLRQEGESWSVATAEGEVRARDVVVALGPWSDVVLRAFDYRLPLGIKRGYHRHYRARGNAVLNHTVFDADGAFVLAPMARGIRLTTGAEFARRDAPPTPVQLAQAEQRARQGFALGEAIDAEPWMGRRPCMPDMLPVIGPAKRHKGLWFDFGHQHLGLTLGPVSGRLIAEMITGAEPFTDPAPYAASRFA